ncbi:MAG: hypothetical protein JWM11_1745 [Planctomycetaceae bacterium]|nr:hypothetical protein [Planctomycetaceae bacterium]
MKTPIRLSLALALLIAVMAQTQGTAAPDKDAEKSEQAVGAFMRKKLKLSEQALEGIVNEDFQMIQKAAEELDKMGRQKEWDVFSLDEYAHFSAEFRRIAKSLGKQAEKKNIDGAVNAYMQMTMSCVECHKFTRRVRMADATPFK